MVSIGFFLVYAAQVALGAIVLAQFQDVPANSMLFSDKASSSLMLLSGEAMLEGMIITLLLVCCPRTVAMFDDQSYLT